MNKREIEHKTGDELIAELQNARENAPSAEHIQPHRGEVFEIPGFLKKNAQENAPAENAPKNAPTPQGFQDENARAESTSQRENAQDKGAPGNAKDSAEENTAKEVNIKTMSTSTANRLVEGLTYSVVDKQHKLLLAVAQMALDAGQEITLDFNRTSTDRSTGEEYCVNRTEETEITLTSTVV